MRWFGLALLGLLIAAAVSIAASRLASQQIGLATEPVTAGDALAPVTPKKSGTPKPQRHPAKHGPAPAPGAPEPLEPEPEYTEPEPAPVEPQPSGGGHDGGGEGADD